MVQQKSLSAVVRAARATVPAGADTPSFAGLVSLKAIVPEPEAEGGKPRKPLDLAVVLDKSGSMASDSKLELCKKTLAFLVETALTENDRLALFAFDSDVTCVFKLTPMNADNKASVLAKIRALTTGSNTNLSAGLFDGLAELQASPPTSVTSVLLLSDGQVNEGITDRAKLVRTLKSTLEASRVRPPVFTFGYGSDADANLMREIAEAGAGTYYPVMSTESVPLAFSDVVGGLLAVVAQNVDVTVTVSGAVIVDTFGSRFPTDVVSPVSRVIHIKDMYAGESRDLLVRLSVPQGRDAVTITAQVRYIDVVLEKPVVLDPPAFVVERTPGADVDASSPEDVEVARHVARAEASAALEAARVAADAGNYAGGMQALKMKKAMIGMDMCALGVDAESDEMVAELMQDLDVGAKAMSDSATWQSEGRHRVAAAALSHANQRSAKADEMISQDAGLLQGYAPKASTYASAVPSKMSMMANALAAFNLRGSAPSASSSSSST